MGAVGDLMIVAGVVASDATGDQGVDSDEMIEGVILEEAAGVAVDSDQGAGVETDMVGDRVVQDANSAADQGVAAVGVVIVRGALAREEIDSVHAALKVDADSKLHIQKFINRLIRFYALLTNYSIYAL